MALDPRTLADAAAHKTEVNPVIAGECFKLGDEMGKLKDELAELTEAAKEVRERYNQIREHDLPERMAEAGMVSASGKAGFALGDGRKIFLQSDLHVHLLAADRPSFFKWLRRRRLGALIKETVNPQTLKAFTKEQIAAQKELPEELQVAPFLKAVIRKA